jgi:hypothetical protein
MVVAQVSCLRARRPRLPRRTPGWLMTIRGSAAR